MPVPVNAATVKAYLAHRAEIQQVAEARGLIGNMTSIEVQAAINDPTKVVPTDWGQEFEDFLDDHMTWGNILKVGAVSLVGGFAVSRLFGGLEFQKEKPYDGKK